MIIKIFRITRVVRNDPEIRSLIPAGHVEHAAEINLSGYFLFFPFLLWERCRCWTKNNFTSSTFLQSNGEIGCVMLGPSCTFATFQLVEWVSPSLHFNYTSTAVLCLEVIWTRCCLTTVMKSAWAWASPSSPPAASVSPVTTNPNWPGFCHPRTRFPTYLFTLWRKSCRLNRNGRRSTSTRSPTPLRTVSGETARFTVQPGELLISPWHTSTLVGFHVLLQVHQCAGGGFGQLCPKH